MRNAGYLFLLGGIIAQNAWATDFADDFSQDLVNLHYTIENLSDEAAPASIDGETLRVIITDSDPSDSDNSEYTIQPRGTLEFLESTVISSPVRPEEGRIGYSIQGRFYNSIANGGPSQDNSDIDDRYGDVNVYVELYLTADSTQDQFLYCIENRTTDGGFETALPGVEPCQVLQTIPVPGETYTMRVGVDKIGNEIFVKVNDEEIRVSAPTEMFEVASPFYQSRIRVRDGASTAQFNIVSLETSNGPINLSTIVQQSPYLTDNFDNFQEDPDRSKTVVDGQLLLSATNNDPEGSGDSFLRLKDLTDYIAADITYSSESETNTAAGGFVAIRLAGALYNETTSNLDGDNTGEVWSSVALEKNQDGILVGEYCVIRSDTADFGETTDLADLMDDDQCPTFDLPVQEDTSYAASMSLDQEEKTLTFRLGDEEQVYNILSDVFPRGERIRAQARISAGATGTVIGYIDNLRNDPSALTDEQLAGLNSTDTEGSTGGSSGGGCSLGSEHSDFSLIILLLAAFGVLGCRRIGVKRA